MKDGWVNYENLTPLKANSNLDEFTVTANQMSLLGKNYDEITTAGKIAFRSKKIELVTEQISTIANKYDNFKCVECAGDIRKFLKNNGEEFEVLDIDLKNIDGTSEKWLSIWSDKKGKNISENGFHTGTLYNDKVYDNIYPNGVSLEDWLSDFVVFYQGGTVDLMQLYEAGALKIN